MAELSKCRSCGQPIMWCKTAATGTLMPLDARPVENGNVIIKDGLAHVLKGELFEEMADGPRFISHFATCPDHAKHRKRK
jgi:hypothetical protein